MDIFLLLKSSFACFALCTGALMLCFFVFGSLLKVSATQFSRVFLVGALFSFLLTDLFLYYKIVSSRVDNAELFLVGTVGGWLGGIFFGLTQLNPLLKSLLKTS